MQLRARRNIEPQVVCVLLLHLPSHSKLNPSHMSVCQKQNNKYLNLLRMYWQGKRPSILLGRPKLHM